MGGEGHMLDMIRRLKAKEEKPPACVASETTRS